MRWSLSLLALLALLAMAAGGCASTTGPSEAMEEIGGGLVFVINEVTGFRAGEERSEPKIQLLILTRRQFGSSCYFLDANLDLHGTVLTVAARGVSYIDAPCFPSAGSAHFQELLPVPNGEYTLRFLYRGFLDAYHLSITDEAIALTPIRARFTEPESDLLWRYPPNSFALACIARTQGSQECEVLADALAGAPGITRFSFPAGGTLPYEVPNDGLAAFFRYEREEDFGRTEEILCALTLSPETWAALTNWKDEWLTSRGQAC